MSFPFNPLRISVKEGPGGWIFQTRHIVIGKIPEIKTVIMYRPRINGKYCVINFKGEKTISWSTDNLETAWRAAWRRLMREDKNAVQP